MSAPVTLLLPITTGEPHREVPRGFRDGEMRRLHHHGELLDVLHRRIAEELLRPRRNRAESAGRDPLRLGSGLLHEGADLQLDLLRRPPRRRCRARRIQVALRARHAGTELRKLLARGRLLAGLRGYPDGTRGVRRARPRGRRIHLAPHAEQAPALLALQRAEPLRSRADVLLDGALPSR